MNVGNQRGKEGWIYKQRLKRGERKIDGWINDGVHSKELEGIGYWKRRKV